MRAFVFVALALGGLSKCTQANFACGRVTHERHYSGGANANREKKIDASLAEINGLLEKAEHLETVQEA